LLLWTIKTLKPCCRRRQICSSAKTFVIRCSYRSQSVKLAASLMRWLYYVSVKLCNMPAVSGICTQALRRWYYNSLSQTCEQLVYSGCGGNANRFDSRGECWQACASQGAVIQGGNAMSMSKYVKYFIYFCHTALNSCREIVMLWQVYFLFQRLE